MSKTIQAALAGALLLVSQAVWPGHVLLSGKFTGAEAGTTPFSETCDDPDPSLGYRNLGSIQVSSTGSYDVADASYQGTGSESFQFGVDVVIRFYDGSFNPENIAENLVGTSIDIQEDISLEENNSYVVVAQHFCSNQAGAFGVSIAGSGDISGSQVIDAPDFWSGEFSPDDATADFGGQTGVAIYDIAGPVQFDESGVYFYSDLTFLVDADPVLYVYKGTFNPADPGENVVAVVDDGNRVTLEAGTDYYFVTHPYQEGPETGSWRFALFPPGEPAANMFLEDAWSNSEIQYQGVLLTVLPTYNVMFLAWFTYDEPASTKQSAGAAPLPFLQSVGDASQRWVSAVGAYSTGASEVPLQFENSFGGAFNSPTPVPNQDKAYGTGRLVIEGCDAITIEYDLPTGPGQGSYSLTRSAPDPLKVDLCESEGLQPGAIE